jgi:hypothetical protein
LRELYLGEITNFLGSIYIKQYSGYNKIFKIILILIISVAEW